MSDSLNPFQNPFQHNKGFINGAWVCGETEFTVFNPATKEPMGNVANLGAKEAKSAIDAATQAFPAWQASTVFERARYLRAWAGLIREHLSQLKALTTKEQGRPIREAEQEWLSGANTLDWFAAEAERIQGKAFPLMGDNTMKMTQFHPLGVVAAITPWNFSVLSVVVKAGAALAAGCTVVLKPSEETPFGALAIAKLAELAQLPRGIFNVVPTNVPEPVGTCFCEDERVKGLTFTGSTAVGKRLAAHAASTVKSVELELGGNAPFIVFADADLEKASNDLIGARFYNNGQICVGANRVYVHESVHQDFLALFLAKVQALRVGDGLSSDTDCGPLINEAACDKLLGLIDDAVNKGAALVLGGTRCGEAGHFFSPTVLTGVTEHMAIRKTEIFGPVTALGMFSDLDEITREANNTAAGLAAYFYTQNTATKNHLLRHLNAGMIGCNTTNIFDQRMGFGGLDQSGHGREGGVGALMPYLVERNYFIA